MLQCNSRKIGYTKGIARFYSIGLCLYLIRDLLLIFNSCIGRPSRAKRERERDRGRERERERERERQATPPAASCNGSQGNERLV